MHHVVYAVTPHRVEAAAAFFSELGFSFATFELADVGLQVSLDWSGGVELVTPMGTEVGRNSAVAKFLAAHGDGIYSVALRVGDIAAAEAVAARYGAVVTYRQHREGQDYQLDEAEASVLGLPLTLLATDLP